MKIFIQVLEYDLQSVTSNSPHTPIIIIDGVPPLKPKKDWDDLDKKIAQLNIKTMNILYYTFEVICEGTNQVKNFKINLYVYKYELLKMKLIS